MEFLYPFESKINPLSDEIEKLTTSWAIDLGLLKSRNQINTIKQMKINSFASYLFPNAQRKLLLPISKIYLILFLLDDIIDNAANMKIIEIEKIYLAFIDILNGVEPKNKNSISDAFQAFIADWQKLVNIEKYQQFIKCFKDYIEFQRWESTASLTSRIPKVSEYNYKKPYSSAAYLAIYFMKVLINFPLQSNQFESLQLHSLEKKASILIWLANDIGNFYNELNKGSKRNYLILLMEEQKLSAEESMQVANQKHNAILLQFIQNCSLLKNLNKPILSKYLKALKHMIAGCHYWSVSETIRYHTNLNGNIIK